MLRIFWVIFALALTTTEAAAQRPREFRGSEAAVDAAYERAHRYDYTFLQTEGQVRRFVEKGLLVKLSGNADYLVHDVRHPYARPEVKLLVERLAAQYRAACGELLVVTSALRLGKHQPRNGSGKSVHPTGMAIDIRLPKDYCRSWIQETLLVLEKRGVVDVTQEHYPPHYHIVVHTKEYACYVRAKGAGSVCAYEVKAGDTLSQIAVDNGTTVAALAKLNDLRPPYVIRRGQNLKLH